MNTHSAEELARALNGKKSGREWKACCPAHDDQDPSLSIADGDGGRVLVTCRSGCTQDAVIEALRKRGFWPSSNGSGGPHAAPSMPPTKPRAAGKGWRSLDAAAEALRVKESGRKAIVHRYPGGTCATVRIDGDQGKTFRPYHLDGDRWKMGDPPGLWPLYGLETLTPGDGLHSLVYVVEGEKCAAALHSLKLPAVTSSHGSKAPDKTDWKPLAGRNVCILPDDDDAGRGYAAKVAEILTALECTVRTLPLYPEGKTALDIADWIDERDAKEPEAIAAELNKLAEGAAAAEAEEAIEAADWIERDPPEGDPILADLFEAGDKVPIIGSSKTRKTFFALQLALSIASGRPSFLPYRIPKPRRVLFVQMEVKATHFHRRVNAMARALGIESSALRGQDRGLRVLNMRGKPVNLLTIAERAKKWGAGVVILDPVYKLLEGDENLAKDVKPFLAMLDRMTEISGAAVLYVHHNAKGTAGDRDTRDRGAGSGTIARDFDASIYLTEHKDGDPLLVIETLLRNYPPQGAKVIEWHEGRFVEREGIEATVKTSRNRDASGRTKPMPRDEEILALFDKGPMRPPALLAELMALGLGKHAAEMARERLTNRGVLAMYDVPTFPRQRFYGTPEQVEAKRNEIERPALPGIDLPAESSPKKRRNRGAK